MSGLLYSILIGGVSGFLAGKLMKGGGYGILLNILLGIIGGAVGGWVLAKLGVTLMDGVIGDLLRGVIGAALFLFVAGLFKKK